VHKPCIRPHGRAFASGVKHPNHLLTYAQNGKRRCLYVPRAMVPALQSVLKNGRHIEKLLYQMVPRLSAGISRPESRAKRLRFEAGASANPKKTPQILVALSETPALPKKPGSEHPH
jgi:hypothetical protein